MCLYSFGRSDENSFGGRSDENSFGGRSDENCFGAINVYIPCKMFEKNVEILTSGIGQNL